MSGPQALICNSNYVGLFNVKYWLLAHGVSTCELLTSLIDSVMLHHFFSFLDFRYNVLGFSSFKGHYMSLITRKITFKAENSLEIFDLISINKQYSDSVRRGAVTF